MGGYVLLPSALGVAIRFPGPWGIPFSKIDSIGAGIALGVLLFDRQAVRRLNPHSLDLLMLAYVAFPLVALYTEGPAATYDAADILRNRLFGWLVCYAVGRLYFADGARDLSVAKAVVLGALAVVPVAALEAMLGPDWYVMKRLYGVPSYSHMTSRLGGWRPDGFFHNGLEMANWLALGAVTAAWLWAGRLWRPPRGPAWLPTLVLVAATVGCRGVYGYFILGVGLVAVVLTLGVRTRVFLAALLLAALVYMSLRATGVWDGESLVRLARQTGRESSVAFRLQAEDSVIHTVATDNLWLGFGTRIWNPTARHQPSGPWPDGWWLLLLWEGGILGLALHVMANHLVPVALTLGQPLGRLRRAEAASVAWGLALFSLLHLLGSLHNIHYVLITPLIAGVLVGQHLGHAERVEKRPVTDPSEAAPRPLRPEAAPMPASVPVVAGLGCLLGAFAAAAGAGVPAPEVLTVPGPALLFAAAGAVAVWAAPRFPAAGLSAYAVCFAALGLSYPLLLHPQARPPLAAALPQGLALAGLVVALGRRWGGDRPWVPLALALPALALSLVPGSLPASLPLAPYVMGGGPADYPLVPWLVVAVLGAWASQESTGVNLTMGLTFAGAAVLTGVSPTALKFAAGPTPTAALTSGAVVGLGFAVARGLNRWAPARAALRWLGARWLLVVFAQAALAAGLVATGLRTPWAVWPLVGAGSFALAGVAALGLRPLDVAMRRPLSWALLGAVVLAAGLIPGLPVAAVVGLAGGAGLVFATQYAALAACLASALRRRPGRARGTAVEEANDVRLNVLRLAAVLALLALPEGVAWVSPRFAPPAAVPPLSGTTSATTNPAAPGPPDR